MSLTLVTAPTVRPITDQQAYNHLRLNDSPPTDAALVQNLIQAATDHIDGRDGWLNRALVTQTWDLSLDGFPERSSKGVRLPLPPVQSVTSITYIDTEGASQTLSASDTDHGWELKDDLYWRPEIALKYGMTWPSTRDIHDAVVIRYVAGYPGDGASPEDLRANVPQPIKQAILLMIGHWYENREAVAADTRFGELPMAVQALLTPYRAW